MPLSLVSSSPKTPHQNSVIFSAKKRGGIGTHQAVELGAFAFRGCHLDKTRKKKQTNSGTLVFFLHISIFSACFPYACGKSPWIFQKKELWRKNRSTVQDAHTHTQKGKSQLQKRISMTCCKVSKTTIGFLLVSIFALPSVFSLQKISKNGAFEVMKAAQAGTPENLWPSLGWRIFLLPCFCKVFLIILHDLVKPVFFPEKKMVFMSYTVAATWVEKKTIIHSF